MCKHPSLVLCVCLLYPNSKCEPLPTPARPLPSRPYTFPLKIKREPVPSVSLHLCCSPHRRPSSGRWPTHCFQEAFPNPGPARPARSCPLGPAATLPPALPSVCTCPAPPTQAASPMHAGAWSMCPEWIMNLSPACRRARQALPGRKPRFPAGVAFRDRPLCPPLRGTHREGRRIKI